MVHIHQILPTLSYGDAIGNETLEIQRLLRERGYCSNIYVESAPPQLSKISLPYSQYKEISSSKNILIFHYSTGSPISSFVRALPDKKIILFHNITPHRYFVGINDYLAALLKTGREELKLFAEDSCLALGDSEYNRRELEELGFKNTKVLPIILDFKKYEKRPKRKILKKYGDGYVNIISVGRVVPNKHYEDIIKTFYYYKNYVNSKSRLFLIGSYDVAGKYYNLLQQLVQTLELENVYLTGMVDFRDLISYYRIADVFLSMSKHEGFCVPLLESMYFKVPIIAYNSSAVPFTLDDSGILVNKKSYSEVAEMISLLVEDKGLRIRIIDNQSRRLKAFEKSAIEKIFMSYIEELLN